MPDYPDVLAVATAGPRLSLDFSDIALAVRPAVVSAGKAFEVLLLIQNCGDCEIDAQVKLTVPEKDLKGTRGRFTSRADKRIAVGLLPAEVGYVSLPALANPQTAPGAGYAVQVEVEIKRTERNPHRIRSAKGGVALDLNQIDEASREELTQLQTLSFSVSTTGRSTRTSAVITAPFEIAPPGINKFEEPPKAGWRSLWTMHQHLDEASLADQARAMTKVLLPQFNRRNVFVPLVQATQAHFEQAGYRLWAGEAVMIAKLMTLILETGQPIATTEEEAAPYPRWFVKLCQLLIQQPTLVNGLETLVTDLLYGELVYDSVLSGFAMLKAATPEDLGSQQEMFDYAGALSKSLTGTGEPLDFVHVYLPLVLAGLLSNERIIMVGEQSLHSVEMLVKAVAKREDERHDGNEFAFELTTQLLDRALALHDTSLQRYLDPIERMRFAKK